MSTFNVSRSTAQNHPPPIRYALNSIDDWIAVCDPVAWFLLSLTPQFQEKFICHLHVLRYAILFLLFCVECNRCIILICPLFFSNSHIHTPEMWDTIQLHLYSTPPQSSSAAPYSASTHHPQQATQTTAPPSIMGQPSQSFVGRLWIWRRGRGRRFWPIRRGGRGGGGLFGRGLFASWCTSQCCWVSR